MQDDDRRELAHDRGERVDLDHVREVARRAGEHVDVFCMRVDDALYEAKKTGKNRIVIK